MEFESDERARTLELQNLKLLLEDVKATESEVTKHADLKTYFKCKPSESVLIEGAFISGNDVVDKIVYTFSGLALEVDQLNTTAKEKFYNALILYGETGM